MLNRLHLVIRGTTKTMWLPCGWTNSTSTIDRMKRFDITDRPTTSLTIGLPSSMDSQGWVFQGDRASSYRAKETKETLKAVCVTVSAANVHELVNSGGCNPIEPM
jgi:hypothetical protein